MEIKEALSKDLENISQLILKDFPYTKSSRENLTERLKKEGRMLFKAEEEGEIAGFIEVEIGEGVGLINGLGVKKKFRGKGYGSMLVEFGVKLLKEMGAGQIVLVVRQGNRKAKKIYGKLGFRSMGKLGKTIGGFKVEHMVLEEVEGGSAGVS